MNLNNELIKKNFLWVTFLLFLFSLIGHWIFGWQTYLSEQELHNAEVSINDYTIEMLRDTLENWQSEFLQLIWQVAGLSFLYYVGSPQSREGDDRKEEKIDYILKNVDPKNYSKFIKEMEAKYPKK